MELVGGPLTGLIEGSHPNWNEQLKVSLESLSGRKEIHSQVHISACLCSSGQHEAHQRGVY